ncbi:nitroreductase family protein [Peptoniphilus sp. GNH]|nr:nitroreductase family protein [Clostridiales bacterium KA00134]UHR02279.1 nitroreductase family protein [Peptoniphilus sp. GNH]
MFYDLACKRRSYRDFTDEEVSLEDLNKIMEAGLLAPTGKNAKSVELVLVRDKNQLKALSTFKEAGACFLEKSKAAIVVLSKKDAPTYFQDASLAAIFIQLACEDMGLGSCWANTYKAKYKDDRDCKDFIRELLEIPSDFHVECVIGLGHKKEELKAKAADRKKIHYDKF